MRWGFAAASVRGTSHVRAGIRLQDAKRCFEVPISSTQSALVAVVADGAGSAARGGEGAAIVCRTIAVAAAAALANRSMLPSDEEIWGWVDDIRDKIQVAAASRSLTARDFATTMVMLISVPSGILTAHIGDGAVVGRAMATKEWSVLSAPAHGEYASTTYFVTDDPTPRLRTARHLEGHDAIAVFSDGIESLVIDYATGSASPGFFGPMVRPLEANRVIGRDHDTSRKLQAFLDGERINERTDDDKTLIIAASHEVG